MKVLATVLTLGFLAVSCGGAESASELQGSSVKKKTEIYKLYSKPNHKPVKGCDIYTELKIEKGLATVATLTNRLDGFCEIFVSPNQRSYILNKERKAGCGSTYLENVYYENGVKVVPLQILDHRSRLCDDVVPATLIISEFAGGKEVKLYSYSK